jgi:acetolactate synthase-1/2/3 large subunit
MHLGFNGEAHLQHADLLLVVDHDVPFVPADMPLADDAHVVVIGIDPIRERWGTWGFPVDEVHAVDPVGALEAIVEAADRPRDEARYDRIRLLHEKMLGGRKLAADGPHLAPGEVGRLLTELAPDAMVFEEAVTSANPFAYGFEPSENGAYIRNGGSYLGWSLGASLGARLGDPSRRVITVVGDGSFMFGAPTPALWTARQQGLPLLVVILNNESYNAVALASDQMFPDGAQVHFGHVGTSLSGAPAFEVIAQACGAWGARVDHREQLRPALEEALRKVDAGQSAVLNVMTVASTRAL